MRALRIAAAAAVAGVALAACGPGSCPREAAAVNTEASPQCSSSSPQEVSVRLTLCDFCSKTSPTCAVDLSAVGTSAIHLDTTWEVCPENASCATTGCQDVTCAFTVTAGEYTVYANTAGGVTSFRLDTSGGAASCTGYQL